MTDIVIPLTREMQREMQAAGTVKCRKRAGIVFKLNGHTETSIKASIKAQKQKSDRGRMGKEIH